MAIGETARSRYEPRGDCISNQATSLLSVLCLYLDLSFLPFGLGMVPSVLCFGFFGAKQSVE